MKSTNQGEATFLEEDEQIILSPKQTNSFQEFSEIQTISPDDGDKTDFQPTSSVRSTNKQTRISKSPNSKRKTKEIFVLNSDDDSDSDTNHLKEDELKLKLKQERQERKKRGEILNQLHENYEELLIKYAQAETTIDQLRFQPKIEGENTPQNSIHFIQQATVNIPTLRSSSIKRTSSTTDRKSVSPDNSGRIESIIFDENASQKIVVEQLTTPETLKLDLILQTKTLANKMKSFLTLMETNQLSLAEQKQVYESIKQDYEKLLKQIEQKKINGDISDLDLDIDLNKELETMKQLIKEIVKKITENLLGKSVNNSPIDRYVRSNLDQTQSSRSSLCNHNELMEQYEKLLNAVNSGHKNTKNQNSSQTNNKQKQFVYESEEESNEISPLPFTKSAESTSLELNYIPSTSVEQIQNKNIENLKKSKFDENFEKNSVSPGSPHRKKSTHRRKPSGNSDIETYSTERFDKIPKSILNRNSMEQNDLKWKPKRKIDFSHTSNKDLSHPDIKHKKLYRSSIYINQTHTYEKSKNSNQKNKFYFDSQTGIIYRYGTNSNENFIQIPSQKNLYQCQMCGILTTYRHRHHINSLSKQNSSTFDDLGYESGYKERNRLYQSDDNLLSSSDSDEDFTRNYRETMELNEAYLQAQKVQHHSQTLLRQITRQLKLAIATI